MEKEKDFLYYKEAAEKGDANAQNNLGICYNDGKGVKQDFKKAVEWYTKAAEQGYADAQYNLALCYANGEGVEQDFEKTVYWYTKAAEQGFARAQNNLALRYDNGEGVKQNFEKAVFWYTKAADQGYAGAQNNLGICYKNGDGVKQDFEKAVFWYTKAAEQNNADAQYNLGNCYYRGEGVNQNYEKAVFWYTKAAEQGDAYAQLYLARCYQYCDGVEQDFEKAVFWYTKAAEQGNADAQAFLGGCYYNGEGVEQDFEKAVHWFIRSANQGLYVAQFCLGVCYDNGDGVEQNYEKAVFWYTKAAEQGHASAQNNLGVCYKNGDGVEQDFEKAVFWYTKAAEQGNPDAQLNLGKCFRDGQGVEKDYKKAQSWFELVTKNPESDFDNLCKAYYNLGIFVMDRSWGFFEDKFKAKEYFEKAAYYGYDCQAELDGVNSELNLNDDSNNKMGQFVNDLIAKGTSLNNLYGEIKDKLSSVFGDVWDMLEDDSKVCLVTACSAYISFASAGKDDYNKFDFSSVITAISKACEIELGKILYDGFRDYLDRNNIPPTEFNPETQKFVKENKSKVPAYEKTNEDEKYNYYRQEKYVISSVVSYEPKDKKGIFTLGGFAKLAGIRKESLLENKDISINGKYKIDNNTKKEIIVDKHFLNYMNEVFKKDAFPEENRIEKIKGYLNYFKNKVSDIAFNLRNPASHDSVMPYWKAVYCGNSVFMADGFLQNFLRKIKG